MRAKRGQAFTLHFDGRNACTANSSKAVEINDISTYSYLRPGSFVGTLAEVARCFCRRERRLARCLW